jgi:hypothetical protein
VPYRTAPVLSAADLLRQEAAEIRDQWTSRAESFARCVSLGHAGDLEKRARVLDAEERSE